MRKLWQRTMIGLARSARARQWAQGSRAGSRLATRFIAGSDIAQAVDRALALWHGSRIRASLFYLGEYVDSPALVERNVAAKVEAARALGRAALDVHVSVDLTQIGHLVDPAAARRNAFAIAEEVARAGHGRPGLHTMMLDMEDPGVIDATIALHDELRVAGLPVAITLQAYLRRTRADLERMVAHGATVRLVKGAFLGNAEIAFPTRAAIKANSRALIELMLGREARCAGFYPIVATHDDRLQAFAARCAAEHEWRDGAWEYEMLLGVRADLARAQARRGASMRVYTPFGEDWWPYALRRIGESPANAWLLARSLAGADPHAA
jgi:proline dehydrogenase